MALTVSFVDRLHGIVEPVQQYLQRDLQQRDVFAPQVVIVPTIGVRSWLTPLLAASLGATEGKRDGIFANVNVHYVGYLQRILRQAAGLTTDPWERNRVNLATLQALDGFSETERLEKKYNGRLNAARILAERFDRYATRRPELIRSWHRGVAALGELSEEKYHWQFKLWERVRDIIQADPWPVMNAELCERLRAGEKIAGIPDRLMIAGFETISPSNMEIIHALSNVIDVELVFVHQSPYLRQQWNEMASDVVPNPAELPLPTQFQPFTASSVPLPPMWMQSSFDLELLLAAYGLGGTYRDHHTEHNQGSTVLEVLQRGVSGAPTKHIAPIEADSSVQIHRAHNLSRQVEILHDALLHAFEEDPTLQPHDVVVLCADIHNAAPVLDAVFDKTVVSTSGQSFTLPLVIADRTLKDISNGAELTSHLLSLMTSLFDFESFMLVASSPLVMKNFSLTPSDLAVWTRHLDNTRLRWGLDAEHRQEHGLMAPKLNAHGWLDAIERTLIGAVMNVHDNAPVAAGGVRPVPFVEASDTNSLITLAAVLSIVGKFEQQTRQPRTIEDWCVLMEILVTDLVGSSCSDMDEVVAVLNSFQRASESLAASPSGRPQVVNFDEFAEYVNGELNASSGRLPLRSGAITATSFVPLRTVPFKVVCVVGFDDGTLPVGEVEGDDLIAATPMLGDGDPKIEIRRVFLDALMAAQKKFIVTCIGRSIKNNKHVPLVTPLSEFLDFCRSCGVSVPDDAEKLSDIEYSHPRHLGNPKNFSISDGPMSNIVWSFDVSALAAAEQRTNAAMTTKKTVAPSVELQEPLSAITIQELELLLIDPLRYYLEKGLRISKEWTSVRESQVLPVAANQYQIDKVCVKALQEQLTDDQITARLYAADILPIAPFDAMEVTAALAVVTSYRNKYAEDLTSSPQSLSISCAIDGAPVISGDVRGYHSDERALSFITFKKKSDEDLWRFLIQLLVLIASDKPVDRGFYFHLHDTTRVAVKRIIKIDESLTPDVARAKLLALLQCEPIARSVACPMFGKTTQTLFANGPSPSSDDKVKAETEFDKFVTDPYSYPGSYELMIFGASPHFSDVYADPDGYMATLLSVRTATCATQKEKNGRLDGWRLIP